VALVPAPLLPRKGKYQKIANSLPKGGVFICQTNKKPRLVLRSLKAIRKEVSIVAMILGRSTPDPRVGSPVELSGRDASGWLNLIRVGETLTRQRIATEQAPPALLQIEPAGACRNEDVLESRMLSHPGPRLSTVMAAEIIGDQEDIADRVVRFDVLQQSDVVRRVARGCTPGQLLAITHTQGSIDPSFFGATAVIERRFDAMPIGRPGRRWREGAWNYWPEFVGA